jgi:hypothetical protein
LVSGSVARAFPIADAGLFARLSSASDRLAGYIADAVPVGIDLGKANLGIDGYNAEKECYSRCNGQNLFRAFHTIISLNSIIVLCFSTPHKYTAPYCN